MPLMKVSVSEDHDPHGFNVEFFPEGGNCVSVKFKNENGTTKRSDAVIRAKSLLAHAARSDVTAEDADEAFVPEHMTSGSS